MKVNDIHSILAAWAPKEIAWERDNVGLQVGDPEANVRGVLVCLDCTEQVILEARKQKADLIVSHHPLLFRAPKSITTADETGRAIRALIENKTNLYSAHTNLDFTAGGTSFAIAEALRLKNVEFLRKSYEVDKKIVTFVPRLHTQKVRNAMAEAGAGIIGNYDYCSFGIAGTGSFRGNSAANPAIGTKGKLESAEEIRLEMIGKQWNTEKIVKAMIAAHPYETVAYDIYPLQNASTEFGMGIIGTLKQPMGLSSFLQLVKKQLNARVLRRTTALNNVVQRIAACGGAGGELVDTAIAQHADVFITADVRYHDFHHATGKITLIDAGHFETEHPVVNAVVRKLNTEIRKLGQRIPVRAAKTSTNPIYYS